MYFDWKWLSPVDKKINKNKKQNGRENGIVEKMDIKKYIKQ